MHNLFLVYFVNLYMFRAYLGPSSGGTTYVYNNWCLLLFLDDCLLYWLGWNSTSKTDRHLKRIISTNCCIHMVVPPDDGPRHARNMYRLTKYTKNKLCIKLVFLYTIISRCTVNKTWKRNKESKNFSEYWQNPIYICENCFTYKNIE